MEYRSLITKFAESLGIADLVFDEHGVTRLSTDEVTIAFMEAHERNSLLMWSNVATPTLENREELYKVLLESSFMGRGTQGATFSLDHGDVYLHRIDPFVNLDVATLSTIVEDFLNLVEKYRHIIQIFHAGDSAKPLDDGTSAPTHGLHGLHGVMWV